MEVSRLGVQSELQVPAYATAIAMWEPNRIFNLHHSSQQRRIINPLTEQGKGSNPHPERHYVLNLLNYNGNSTTGNFFDAKGSKTPLSEHVNYAIFKHNSQEEV